MVSERCHARANIEVTEIIQALPGLGHYKNTNFNDEHGSRKSWSCTAGVWLQATYLLTDVGCAEGHHKIVWYLPGEPRVYRRLSVDLRYRLSFLLLCLAVAHQPYRREVVVIS